MRGAAGAQHRALPGQALVVQNNPHQAGGRVAGLRGQGDRQQCVRGRLLQLHHPADAAKCARRRHLALLRLLPGFGSHVDGGRSKFGFSISGYLGLQFLKTSFEDN